MRACARGCQFHQQSAIGCCIWLRVPHCPPTHNEAIYTAVGQKKLVVDIRLRHEKWPNSTSTITRSVFGMVASFPGRSLKMLMQFLRLPPSTASLDCRGCSTGCWCNLILARLKRVRWCPVAGAHRRRLNADITRKERWAPAGNPGCRGKSILFDQPAVFFSRTRLSTRQVRTNHRRCGCCFNHSLWSSPVV